MKHLRGHSHRKASPDYVVNAATGCWEWQLKLTPRRGGYGIAWDPQARRSVRAHRLYYERFVGPIPAGMEIDHLCKNRRCVNPEHLESVTKLENIQRSGNAKLTMEDARAIRSSPLRGRDLAAQYGVARSVISAIRRHRTWKEPAPPPQLSTFAVDLEIARRLQVQARFIAGGPA